MPGGSSQVVPPFAIPVACQASASAAEAAVNPMVPPLANVAGLPSIGFETENVPVLVRIEDAMAVDRCRRHAEGPEQLVVECLGAIEIVGPDHDVREHFFVSFPKTVLFGYGIWFSRANFLRTG